MVWRMIKIKKIVIVFAIFLAVIMMTAIFFNAPSILQKDSDPNVTLASYEQAPANISVNLLGNSDYSSVIKEDLKEFTSKVTQKEVTDFSSKADEDILMIDGIWLENEKIDITDTIKQELLKGIPIIILQGSPNTLIKSIEGQNISYAFATEPLIACGLKYYSQEDLSSGLSILGTTGDSKDLQGAVQTAYEWGSKYLTNINSTPEPTHHSPWWHQKYIQQVYSYDWAKPYGKVNILNQYYKLEEDGTNSYDFYDNHFVVEELPGYTVHMSDATYGDEYRCMDIYVRSDVNEASGHSSDFLYYRSPTTTSGTSTAAVSIGVSAGQNGGAVTLSHSWSYSIPDVTIEEQGDYGQQLGMWWHNVAEGQVVGRGTYQVEPGLSVRTSQGGGHGLYETYQVNFGTWFLYWYVTFNNQMNVQGTIY
jgi:hypothetical protein